MLINENAFSVKTSVVSRILLFTLHDSYSLICYNYMMSYHILTTKTTDFTRIM